MIQGVLPDENPYAPTALRGLLLPVLLTTAASADVPRALNFQGVLTDDAGLPLTGDYEFTFRIYADTSEAPVWSQVTPLHAEGGFYEAVLEVAGFSFDDSLYLGVEVGGSALGPKKLLASVPHALSVPDGSVSLAKIDTAGALPGAVMVYDGNTLTWEVPAGSSGDITALEAGNGLAGGGASGDVAVWIDTGGVGTMEIVDGSVTAPKISSGQVVKSLNSLSDTARIVAGSQVSVLESGDSISGSTTTRSSPTPRAQPRDRRFTCRGSRGAG